MIIRYMKTIMLKLRFNFFDFSDLSNKLDSDRANRRI